MRESRECKMRRRDLKEECEKEDFVGSSSSLILCRD